MSSTGRRGSIGRGGKLSKGVVTDAQEAIGDSVEETITLTMLMAQRDY
jgi:hypothetical protein